MCCTHKTVPSVYWEDSQMCVSITHTRGLDRQRVVQYSSRCVGFQKPYRHVVEEISRETFA